MEQIPSALEERKNRFQAREGMPELIRPASGTSEVGAQQQVDKAPVKFFNVILTSISTDDFSCAPDAVADVDLKIIKVKSLRDSSSSSAHFPLIVKRDFVEKTVRVKLSSCDRPVIAIPASMCDFKGPILRSLHFVMRVTFPNLQGSNEEGTLPSKRTRVPKRDSTFVYFDKERNMEEEVGAVGGIERGGDEGKSQVYSGGATLFQNGTFEEKSIEDVDLEIKLEKGEECWEISKTYKPIKFTVPESAKWPWIRVCIQFKTSEFEVYDFMEVQKVEPKPVSFLQPDLEEKDKPNDLELRKTRNDGNLPSALPQLPGPASTPVVNLEDFSNPDARRLQMERTIDQYTDVNQGEKEMMKMWNAFMIKNNYTGDCQIVSACEKFVSLHGTEIIDKNLYRNFTLHLTCLFDFGLLNAEQVHQIIKQLHALMQEDSTGGHFNMAMKKLTVGEGDDKADHNAPSSSRKLKDSK